MSILIIGGIIVGLILASKLAKPTKAVVKTTAAGVKVGAVAIKASDPFQKAETKVATGVVKASQSKMGVALAAAKAAVDNEVEGTAEVKQVTSLKEKIAAVKAAANIDPEATPEPEAAETPTEEPTLAPTGTE